MEINGNVELPAPKLQSKGEVPDNAAEPSAPRCHDYLAQPGVVFDDGGCGRFNQVGQPGLGIAIPHRPNRGRREHDVADLAEPDEENLQGNPRLLFDRRFVD